MTKKVSGPGYTQDGMPPALMQKVATKQDFREGVVPATMPKVPSPAPAPAPTPVKK